MKHFWKFVLIINVVLWSWNIYFFCQNWQSIANYYYDRDRAIGVFQSDPIDLGIQFDFCEPLTELSDPVAQLQAGTPVPYEQVSISTEVVPISTPGLSLTATPPSSPVPTISPAPPQESDREPMRVVKVGNYHEDNYHFVYVGVGYNEENVAEFAKLINEISANFSGIKIDFAYVDSSIEADFKHVNQAVEFTNESDQARLLKEIKKVYPADGVVVLLNTSLVLGTKGDNFAILSGSDPNTNYIATHEIAHLLGLDDGYQFIYGKESLPSSELFYVDKMPLKLVNALEKMDEWPTIYKVGNCSGVGIYSFYESNNNVMRDYAPSETKSWGTSTFTPLQTILMNDYILWYKGEN